MRKWVTRILYFVAGIIGLLLLFLIFLQTNWAKNIIRNKLESYIADKTNTEFNIASIDYRLPNWIELNGVMMRDQNNDTLLFGSKIKANVAMLKLISGKYEVNKILLDNIFVNLHKKENDSVFNFQFIINAFTSGGSKNSSSNDTSSIDLSIHELILKKVRFNMLDDATGSYTRFKVSDLSAVLNKIDVNTVEIDVKKIYADGLHFEMLQEERLKNKSTSNFHSESQPASAKTNYGSKLPIINADSLFLTNSFIGYTDDYSEIKSANNINYLLVTSIGNKENNNKLEANKIDLRNSTIDFNHRTSNNTKEESKVVDTSYNHVETNELAYYIKAIDLSNNRITYNNTAMPAQINGLDYNHLAITGLRLNASNSVYDNGKLQTTIEQFSFAEKSGFQLDSLAGTLTMDNAAFKIDGLLIKTPNSVVRGRGYFNFPSDSQTKNITTSQSSNQLKLTNTILSEKDFTFLANPFTQKYKKQISTIGNFFINVDATSKGNELYFTKLDVRSLNNTSFSLNAIGSLENIYDTKDLGYNVKVKNMTASRQLIDPFVNDIKQLVQLPPLINLSGTARGTLNSVQTDLVVNSSFGNAKVSGSLVNFQDPSRMNYNLNVKTNSLETGKWIYKEAQLGKITGTIKLKGKNGFDYKTSAMDGSTTIQSFRYEKNLINNINLNFASEKALAKLSGSINDELLKVNLNLKANLKSNYPTANGIININRANLYALGFVADSLTVRTIAKINIENTNPNRLDVILQLDSTSIATSDKKIFIDSILLSGLNRNDSTLIALQSPIANAEISSNLTYEQMPVMINNIVANYLPSQFKKIDRSIPPGAITGEISVLPNEVIPAIAEGFDYKNVVAIFNLTNTDKDSSIYAKINADLLAVNGMKLNNLSTIIKGGSDSLLLSLNADTIQSGNILLYDVIANGGYAHDNFTIAMHTSDKEKEQQYALSLSGNLNNETKGWDISLHDPLMLNYKSWELNQKNKIQTGSTGFNINNFEIKNGQQRVALQSETGSLGAPLKVTFNDFLLSSVTSIFNQDSTKIEGLINADFTASKFNQSIPDLQGKLLVDSIQYHQQPVGNLIINAGVENEQIKVNGKLSGNGNDINLEGKYNANTIDANIILQPLTLASLQPFTAGNLERSSGIINGSLSVTGKTSDPQWNGELRFDSVQTIINQFGTFVKIDNQKILLTYPNISLNNFLIKDSLNHEIKINGSIVQNGKKDFITDLNVSANDFNVINSTAADNKLIYGKAIISIDGNVKGPLTSPELNGNVTIKNGTKVTYVQPTSAESLKERDGVIEFVDMDTVQNLLTQRKSEEIDATEKKATTSKGFLQYNVNLEVEKEAEFVVIIDPATGDELHVKGDGQINASVLPNGEISLAGVYHLKSGSYQLNYGPVKRKFMLKDGSTIQLSGDPNNAQLDIKAAYEIETSPIDLVSNEIGGSTSTESERYKRKVPFEVLLTIKGTAQKPELGFDIQVKEKAAGVSSELQNTIDNKLAQLRNDASAMNKQVFALLALNRFIGDESSNFFGGSGGNSNNNLLANQSVSAFLNEAIDQIAADLIKGVDVDINLQNRDDPNNQGTDLNLALGKTFLNDRLSISVGQNFSLDGNDATTKGRNSSNNNVQFIPNVNTSYKLSKDGRYVLRAYRRNQYEAILDGYFIETGVAFTLTLDYNKFKEIFRNKKK